LGRIHGLFTLGTGGLTPGVYFVSPVGIAAKPLEVVVVD
jgi:hypothetical protein